MSHYIHHLPGRLRVKSPGLKRNEREAARTRAHLDQLHGVQAAEVNTVTGSILIHYDAQQVGAQALIDTLRRLGHIPTEQAQTWSYRGPGLAQKLSDAVVNKLIETALERSATALVAAIL